ncbi:MAG: hypothetical protein HUU29_14265 [Planctomycetaceae bacterium]|nr:hypothetical protein [Planctomycetaceae bacterium]
MKITLIAALIVFLALGCGDDANTNVANNSGNATPAPSSSDAKATRDKANAIAKKAWSYLEANYNKSTGNPLDDTWGPNCNVAFSGMILHGALRCGLIKPDDQRVRDTVDAMVKQQQPTGQWTLGGSNAVYTTSIAYLTLAWLRDNGGAAYREQLSGRLDKAREYLTNSQVGAPKSPLADVKKETDSTYGGWAYSKEELADPKNAGKPKANLSTTSFAIEAASAFGLKPDDPLWQRALTYLERNHNSAEVSKGLVIRTAEGKEVVDPPAGDPNAGGARYSPDTSKANEIDMGDGKVMLRSYGSMTYALLSCYMAAGLKRTDPRVELAYKWITHNFSVSRVPGYVNTENLQTADQQGLYYQYMQMGRALSLYGSDMFKDSNNIEVYWKKDLVAQLERSQKPEGYWKNDKQDRWYENLPMICTGYVLSALADVMK